MSDSSEQKPTATGYYLHKDYTMLPAHLTWDRIHKELLQYVGNQGLEVAVTAALTMRQLVLERCPTIGIRSVRSNVCDECAIYQSSAFGRRQPPTIPRLS